MQVSKNHPSTPLAVVSSVQALDPAADFSNADCAVELYGSLSDAADGKCGAEITVKLDAATVKRLVSRAAGQDLADYVWLNIFRRAVMDHVY